MKFLHKGCGLACNKHKIYPKDISLKLTMKNILGMGGGYLSRSLQQRFLRHLPSSAGTNPVKQRGQVYPCVGHEQKDMLAYF